MMERWGYHVSAYHEQREALDAVCRRGSLRPGGDRSIRPAYPDWTSRGVCDAQPDLPVIVVSGYVTDALRAGGCAGCANRFQTEEVEEPVTRSGCFIPEAINQKLARYVARHHRPDCHAVSAKTQSDRLARCDCVVIRSIRPLCA
jgi:hypothetical protein